MSAYNSMPDISPERLLEAREQTRQLLAKSGYKGVGRESETQVALEGLDWKTAYETAFSKTFVDGLAPHHVEAVNWHWGARAAFLKGEYPEYDAYFPIWSRGHNKCVDSNTPVLLTDGRYIPIKDIEEGFLVQTLNEASGQIESQKVIKKWATGRKPCVEVRTRTGWCLTASPDHRVRTFDGWRQIAELLPSDRIASPRQTLSTEFESGHSDEEVRLLAYFLMEGQTTFSRTSVRSNITNADEPLVLDVIHCAESLGFKATRSTSSKYRIDVKGGVIAWIRANGLAGKKATEKRVPDWVFQLPKRQLEQFLAVVIDTDGCISIASVCVALANSDLVDDIRRVCSQLGIVTTKYTWANGHAGVWYLAFDNHNLGRLMSLPLRAKQGKWARLLSKKRYSLLDTYPQVVTSCLPKGLNRRLRREIRWKPSYDHLRVTRDKIQRAIAVEPLPQWTWLEHAQVYWDEIVSIAPVGEHDTYDISVESNNNFIANGLVTHNSGIARRVAVIDGILSYQKKTPAYILYLSRNKDMALKHAKSVETLLQSKRIKELCPAIAEVQRNDQKRSKGWTASFIYTKANVIYHFAGLDEGLAGGNIETNLDKEFDDDTFRPDVRVTLFVPDDIDGREDSPVIAESRFKTLTDEVLPMGQENSLVFFAQNLISRYSVMYRIHKQQARVLTGRKPTSPVKAVLDLRTETRTVGGIVQDTYVSGTSTWPVWDANRIQREINRFGLPAFLRECQHEVEQDRTGLVLQHYDDAVHVISKSEFASVFGTKEMPRSWYKYGFNDWARTKTKFHANAFGVLAASGASSRKPSGIFLFNPMSFPAASSPEDVAIRFLKAICPAVYKDGKMFTWDELRDFAVNKTGIERLIHDESKLIQYRRSALADIIPSLVAPILNSQNFVSFKGSHEQNSKEKMTGVLEVYRRIFGLPFNPANPGFDGGLDELNMVMKVDYAKPHAFRSKQKGYTNFHAVVEDDTSRDFVLVNGIEVYPPVPYQDALQPDDLHDGDLFRYQAKNCRHRDPYLTVQGEREGEILRLNDDFIKGLMFVFMDGIPQPNPLSREEWVEELIPEGFDLETLRQREDLTPAQAEMSYSFAKWQAEKRLKPKVIETDEWGQNLAN